MRCNPCAILRVFGCVVLVASCGSGGSDPAPSTGPNGTSSGSNTGAPADDRRADPPASEPSVPGEQGDGCYPGCLATLFASCQPSGACTTSNNQTSDQFDFAQCFTNGVKRVKHFYYAGGGKGTDDVTINGRLCYSYETVGSTPPRTFTYKDARGGVVAILDAPDTSGIVTVRCNDRTYTVDLGSSACQALNAAWVPSCPTDPACTY